MCARAERGVPHAAGRYPYGGAPAPGAAIFATELAGPPTYLPPLPTVVGLDGSATLDGEMSG